MRTEAQKLQRVVADLAVDEDEIGLDVTIAMIFRIARQPTIAIPVSQRLIRREDIRDFRDPSIDMPGVFAFFLTLVVAAKPCQVPRIVVR